MHQRHRRLLNVLARGEQRAVGHLEVPLLGAQHEDLLVARVGPACEVGLLVPALLADPETQAQGRRDDALAVWLGSGRDAKHALEEVGHA